MHAQCVCGGVVVVVMETGGWKHPPLPVLDARSTDAKYNMSLIIIILIMIPTSYNPLESVFLT